jgi:RNA polymerase sigma-70 factor (ECF subfamily)
VREERGTVPPESGVALRAHGSGVRPAIGRDVGYAEGVEREATELADESAEIVAAPRTKSDAPPASIEQLYRAHSSYVAGIALRLLGRDAEVDDVVQDVFLSAWKGITALRDPGAVKGWLATVTVRIARRKLRMRRVKQFFRFDDDPDSAYENVPAPGASAEERVLLAKIYALLDGLPVDQRLAWTLRYVERQQLEDVAKMCGCSLATAKRRISAAQSALDGVIHD